MMKMKKMKKPKIDFKEILLEGIVLDTSHQKKDDDMLLDMFHRVVVNSHLEPKEFSDLAGCDLSIVKRMISREKTPTGLDYNPRSSTYDKLLKARKVYIALLEKPKRKPKLKTIKGGKKSKK